VCAQSPHELALVVIGLLEYYFDDAGTAGGTPLEHSRRLSRGALPSAAEAAVVGAADGAGGGGGGGGGGAAHVSRLQVCRGCAR
jgi:hypothetical protein